MIGMSCVDMQFCCGVTELGDFGGRYTKDPKYIVSGTGYAVATFIDTPACKTAYKWLSEHFKILYQSPPRGNAVHNDRTQVFVVVYEVNKDPYDYDEGSW